MTNEICGIYKIENLINHHLYVGQSIDIKKRWREHKSGAFNENNKDYNMVIYKAIRKYGIENFEFSIIELCDKDDLNDREVYWIEYYDSYTNGYNASKGGDNYEHIGNIIELYDLEGNYVTEYPNMKEVSRNIHVSYSVVCQVVYGRRLSAKGYQMKVKNSEKQISKYKSRQGGSIPVYQLNDSDNVINTYESSYDAARQLGLDPSCIIKCCKGKMIHHGGYKWRYAT